MDIRDIKEEPLKPENGYLEEIYKLQKSLIDHYVSIEGLPSYPVEPNSKKSQILIKDFVGRVIEELGEGYESLVEAQKLILALVKDGTDGNEERVDLYKAQIQNFNEEQADALHFFVELLIYLNIQPEDIHSFLKSENIEYAIYPLENIEACRANAKIIGRLVDKVNFTDAELKYCPGGRMVLDTANIVMYASVLWEVTYKLSIARNCLKNKPWKQTQVLTDTDKMQRYVVEAFLLMVESWLAIGISVEDIYRLYFKKNKVNEFRIKSKY